MYSSDHFSELIKHAWAPVSAAEGQAPSLGVLGHTLDESKATLNSLQSEFRALCNSLRVRIVWTCKNRTWRLIASATKRSGQEAGKLSRLASLKHWNKSNSPHKQSQEVFAGSECVHGLPSIRIALEWLSHYWSCSWTQALKFRTLHWKLTGLNSLWSSPVRARVQHLQK